MTTVRLLADDLTGALDTAAELVGLAGPIPAFWHGALPPHLPPSAAIDSGTRERPDPAAVAITGRLAGTLGAADIAFKKVDSLMRGPTLPEVAACVRHGAWERAIMAPAFPYQGRITRNGVQHASGGDGAWRPVGGDIVARLRAEGVAARAGSLDRDGPPGISVFDAETNADLRRIAAFGRTLHPPVLWVGTGGLAHALAGGAGGRAPPLPAPILGLFGSDQGVTVGQLRACGDDWLRLAEGGTMHAGAVRARLDAAGRAMVSLALPDGLGRDVAAARIAAGLGRLARDLPPPGTLVVAGGETLRGLCLSLGTRSLDVQGRIVPGMPCSTMRGGRWDGVAVVSKSGAFGPPGLLRDLLHDTLTFEGAV